MTGVMSQSIPSNKLTDDIKLGKVAGRGTIQIILDTDWRNGPTGTS